MARKRKPEKPWIAFPVMAYPELQLLVHPDVMRRKNRDFFYDALMHLGLIMTKEGVMADPNVVSIPADMAEFWGIQYEPDWSGPFTRQQAPDAILNGTRVKKVWSDPEGDLNPPGTLGTVLGSISAPEIGIGYFVEWDSRPKHAIFVVSAKIATT